MMKGNSKSKYIEEINVHEVEVTINKKKLEGIILTLRICNIKAT